MLQVAVIYLLFICVVSILFWVIRKFIRNKLITVLFSLILISPFSLYIPIEVNTYLHGKEFKNVKIETMCSGKVIYHKIFSINNKKAKLFFVQGKNGQHEAGNFYYFVKKNGKWKFDSWGQTMWVKSGGSASEFTLPPYF